jgi:hypothetical protein
MRKIQIAICATAALGLCLMVTEGASAFPAADGTGKAYTQTVEGKSAAVPVYLRRGYWGGRVGLGRGIGWRRGWGWRGYGWRGVGLGRGWGWRRVGWRRGYYGGWGWGGYGLGLGLGYGATGWGGGYYGGRGGCCGCGC